MPTQSESPAAVSGTSLEDWFNCCARGSASCCGSSLVLAVCVAVAAAALAIWWLNSLNGLPDIGDPFDVAAFRAFSVPDDQNAFTFLRRANEKLTPIRGSGREGAYPDDSKFSWSIANPKLREWAGENREALELFLQGAEQADAAHPAGDPTADWIRAT